MTDLTQINPAGITTAALAGSAIGSAVPPTAKFVKAKLEGTKVDAFVSNNTKKVSKFGAEVATRIKNAFRSLFPKKETTKVIKNSTKISGMKKLFVNVKTNIVNVGQKFVKPTLQQLKKSSVAFPILGAIIGATTYILVNKNKID